MCTLHNRDVSKRRVEHHHFIRGTNEPHSDSQADCERWHCLASVIVSGLLQLSQRVFVAATCDSSAVIKELHKFAVTVLNFKVSELFALVLRPRGRDSPVSKQAHFHKRQASVELLSSVARPRIHDTSY